MKGCVAVHEGVEVSTWLGLQESQELVELVLPDDGDQLFGSRDPPVGDVLKRLLAAAITLRITGVGHDGCGSRADEQDRGIEGER